jgi:hypothetical protein
MFKKMRTFGIDLKGKIHEEENYTTIELASFWSERVQNGAELAVIKTPAIPTDEQLNLELLIAEIQSLGENPTSWVPDPTNAIDSFLMALYSQEIKNLSRAKAIYNALGVTSRVRRDIARSLDRFQWEGKRYANHAMDATTYLAEVDMGFIMLKIDREGEVSQMMDAARPDRPARGPLATRTIAGRRYPGIRLVQVTVPTRMTEEEKSKVRNAMKCIVWGGRRYVEVLGTGGIKNGQFIYVEQSWSKAIAKQYHMHPQSALSYGGIIVNECDKALETIEATIRIVKEGDLGTNDSRGWMDESVFAQLKSLNPGHFYQFRGDFIASALTLVGDNFIGRIPAPIPMKRGLDDTPVQCKGVLKTMRNEAGAHPLVAANIVIPDSSLKPKRPDLIGKSFRCTINLGVTEQSYDGTCFGGPTVATHFPWGIIKANVIPDSEREMRMLAQGFDSEGHPELIRKIGAKVPSGSDAVMGRKVKNETEFMRVLEACLAADGNGSMMRHPFVHSGTKRLLADYLRKLMSGGIEMHTRALADDGYLVVDQAGKLHHGHDWMPERAALSDYSGFTQARQKQLDEAKRDHQDLLLKGKTEEAEVLAGKVKEMEESEKTAELNEPCLTVRFPVRMRDDLLPTRLIHRAEGTKLLAAAFPEMPAEAIQQAIEEQIYLKHVQVLNGKYAKKFGGDFDYDLVYILGGDRYPKLVEWRNNLEETALVEKDKAAKKPSFWQELGRVSFDAMGNKVGQVTNTILSAIACGQWEQQYPLAEELQKEVGGLKHGTRADMKRVAEIQKEFGIKNARWIKKLAKDDIKSFDDLPTEIEPMSDDDVIARMYNELYVTAKELLGDPRELTDYSSLFDGLYGVCAVDDKHKREVKLLNSFYGGHMSKVSKHVAKKREDLNLAAKAQAELREAGNYDAASAMNNTIRGLEADLEKADLDAKKGRALFRNIVCGWGAGKAEEEKMYWAAVANEVICAKSRYTDNQNSDGTSTRRPSTGSILMHAFPQQFVTAVAEATGGRNLPVDTWKHEWHVTLNIDTLAITKVEADADGKVTETLLYQGYAIKKKLPNGNTIPVTEWKRMIKFDALDFDEEELEEEVAA